MRLEKRHIMRNTYFRFILFSLVMIMAASCANSGSNGEKLPADMVKNPKTASGKNENKGMPAITFEENEHDFGKVIQGEKVSYHFKFENTGKSDLIITDVSSSCGCTVPKFTREPVKPGQEGNILVTFDSGNRKGYQNKTVTVVSNTNPNTKVLRIKAQVIVPEKL